MKSAVDRRKADFGDARWCAHAAMTGFAEDQPILSGERGMPVFPDGVTGSLTHTEGLRAALVGRSSRWLSLGIDAEPATPLPEGVFNTIARPEEQRRIHRLARAEGIAHVDKVLFSAKETTYKAWFPLTHRFLDSIRRRLISARMELSAPTCWCVRCQCRSSRAGGLSATGVW